VGHLPLVGVRDGKPSVRWSLLLVRFGVYFVLFGAIVYLVTWASDLVFEKHDRANLPRTISIPGFLAILFVVHDLRKDLKSPLKDLPDLDRGTGSDAE
jgi:hypothetical protein